MIEADADFEPPKRESRELFGMHMMQDRNDYQATAADLAQILCGTLTPEATRDLLLALVAVEFSVRICDVFSSDSASFLYAHMMWIKFARVRTCALIAHVTASLGWLGAVVAFLALALAGLTSDDAALVRSAYVTMAFIGWYVLVPFSIAALATGLVQSVGTEWGLFRHYWVVIKLLITIGATVLLPMHLRAANRLSRFAVERAFNVSDLRGLRVQIAVDAAAAVLVLLTATILSVCKPWGRIQLFGAAATSRSRLGVYALIALAALMFVMIVLHHR